MKTNKKMLLLIGISFLLGVFLVSIIYQYIPTFFGLIELKSNIEYFEPSRDLKYHLLIEGKTIVLIYNYSNVSVEELENIVNVFSKKVYFFLINSTNTFAFIISPIYEKTIFNLTHENLFKEICKASIEVPKECIEII